MQLRNGSPFWNFSNPEARAYYLNEMVASAAREAGSNLLFFDSNDAFFCGLVNTTADYAGPTAGTDCPELRFTAADLAAAYADVLSVMRSTAQILNAVGKVPPHPVTWQSNP